MKLHYLIALCATLLGLLSVPTCAAPGSNVVLDYLNITYPTPWYRPLSALQEDGLVPVTPRVTPALITWTAELTSIFDSSLIFGRPSTFSFKMIPVILPLVPLSIRTGDYVTLFSEYLAPITEGQRVCNVAAFAGNGNPISITTTEVLSGSLLTGRTVRLTFQDNFSMSVGATFTFTCGPVYNSFNLGETSIPVATQSIVTATLFSANDIIASNPAVAILGLLSPATSTIAFSSTSNRFLAMTTVTLTSTLSVPYIVGDSVTFSVPFGFLLLFPHMCTATVHGTGEAEVTAALSVLGTTTVTATIFTAPPTITGEGVLEVKCTGRGGRWPSLLPLMTAVTTNGVAGVVSIATGISIPAQTVGEISLSVKNPVTTPVTKTVMTFTASLDGAPFYNEDGLHFKLPFIILGGGSILCRSLTAFVTLADPVQFLANALSVRLLITVAEGSEAPTSVTFQCTNMRTTSAGPSHVPVTLHPETSGAVATWPDAVAEGESIEAFTIGGSIAGVQATMQIVNPEISRNDVMIRIVFGGSEFTIAAGTAIHVNLLPLGFSRPTTGITCTISGVNDVNGNALDDFMAASTASSGSRGYRATMPPEMTLNSYNMFQFVEGSQLYCGPFITGDTPISRTPTSVSALAVSTSATIFNANTFVPAITDPSAASVLAPVFVCDRGQYIIGSETGFKCTIPLPGSALSTATTPVMLEMTLDFPDAFVTVVPSSCTPTATAVTGGPVTMHVDTLNAPTSTRLTFTATLEPSSADPLGDVSVVFQCMRGVINPEDTQPDTITLSGSMSGGVAPDPPAYTLASSADGFLNGFIPPSDIYWYFSASPPWTWRPDQAARPSSFMMFTLFPQILQMGTIRLESPLLYATPDFSCELSINGNVHPSTTVTSSKPYEDLQTATNAITTISYDDYPMTQGSNNMAFSVACTGAYSPASSAPTTPMVATLFASNDAAVSLPGEIILATPTAVTSGTFDNSLSPTFTGSRALVSRNTRSNTQILPTDRLRFVYEGADFISNAPECYVWFDGNKPATATTPLSVDATTVTFAVPSPQPAIEDSPSLSLECLVTNPLEDGTYDTILELINVMDVTVFSVSEPVTLVTSDMTGIIEFPSPIAGIAGPLILTVNSLMGIEAGTTVTMTGTPIADTPQQCSVVSPATGVTIDVKPYATGEQVIEFSSVPTPAPTQIQVTCEVVQFSTSSTPYTNMALDFSDGETSLGQALLEETTFTPAGQITFIASLTPSTSGTTDATLNLLVVTPFTMLVESKIAIQLPSLVRAPATPADFMRDRCSILMGTTTIQLEASQSSSGAVLIADLPEGVPRFDVVGNAGTIITCTGLTVGAGTRAAEAGMVTVEDSLGNTVGSDATLFPAITSATNDFGQTVLTAAPSSTVARAVAPITFTVSAALDSLAVGAIVSFEADEVYDGSFDNITSCTMTAPGSLSWEVTPTGAASALAIEVTAIPSPAPDSTIETVTITCEGFSQAKFATPATTILAFLTPAGGGTPQSASVTASLPAVTSITLDLAPMTPFTALPEAMLTYVPISVASWPQVGDVSGDAVRLVLSGGGYQWENTLVQFPFQCSDGTTMMPVSVDADKLHAVFVTPPTFTAGEQVSLLCGPVRTVDTSPSTFSVALTSTADATDVFAMGTINLPPVIEGTLPLEARTFTYAPEDSNTLSGSITLTTAGLNGLGQLTFPINDPDMTTASGAFSCTLNGEARAASVSQSTFVINLSSATDLMGAPALVMQPAYAPGSRIDVSCQGVLLTGEGPWEMSSVRVTAGGATVAETAEGTPVPVILAGDITIGPDANVTFSDLTVATETTMKIEFTASAEILSGNYGVKFAYPTDMTFNRDIVNEEDSFIVKCNDIVIPSPHVTIERTFTASSSGSSGSGSGSGGATSGTNPIKPSPSGVLRLRVPMAASTPELAALLQGELVSCSVEVVGIITPRGVPATQGDHFPVPLQMWLFNNQTEEHYLDTTVDILMPPFVPRVAGSTSRGVSSVTSSAPGDITDVTVSLRPLVDDLALHVGERLYLNFDSEYEVNAGGVSQCSLTVGGTKIPGMTYTSREQRLLTFMPFTAVPASSAEAVFTCTRIRNPETAPDSPVIVNFAIMTSDFTFIALADGMSMPELRPYTIGNVQNMAAIRYTNGKYELNIQMNPLDWPFVSGDVVRFAVPSSVSLRKNTNCRAVMGNGPTKYPIAATTTVDAAAGMVSVALRANFAQVPATSNKALNLWCSPVYNDGGSQTTRLIPDVNVQAYSPRSGVLYTDVRTTISGSLPGAPSIFNPLPAISDLFNKFITAPIVAIDAIGNLFISFDAGMSFPIGTAVVLFAPEQNRDVNQASLVCLVNGMVAETRTDAQGDGTFAIVLSEAFLFLPGEALDIACTLNNEILMLIPLRIEDPKGNSAPINPNPAVSSESMARIGDYELSLNGFTSNDDPFTARLWSVNATLGNGDMVAFMIPDGYTATTNTTVCTVNFVPATPPGTTPASPLSAPVITTVIGDEVRLSFNDIPAGSDVLSLGGVGFPQYALQYDMNGQFDPSVGFEYPVIADPSWDFKQWRMGATEIVEISCTGMERVVEPRIASGATASSRVASTYVAGTLVAAGNGDALNYYSPPTPSPVPIDTMETLLTVTTSSPGPALAGQLSPIELELRNLPTSLMPGDKVTVTFAPELGWEVISTTMARAGTWLAGEDKPQLADAQVTVTSDNEFIVELPSTIRTVTLAEAQAGNISLSLAVLVTTMRAPLAPSSASATGAVAVTINDPKEVEVLTYPSGHAQMPPVALPEIHAGQGVLVFPFESGAQDATVFFSFSGPAAYGNNSHITFPVGATLSLEPTATHLPSGSSCTLNTRPTAGAAAVSTSGQGLALTVVPDEAAPELPSGTIHVVVCRPLATTEDEADGVPDGAASVVGGKASSSSTNVSVSGVYDVATFGSSFTLIKLIPLRSANGAVVMDSPGTIRSAVSVTLTLPFGLPKDSQLTMSLPTASWAFDVATATCSLSITNQGKGMPVAVSVPVSVAANNALPTLVITLSRPIPAPAATGESTAPTSATIVCGGVVAPIASQTSEDMAFTIHYPHLPLGPGEALSRPRVISYTAQHPPVQEALDSDKSSHVGVFIALNRTEPLSAKQRTAIVAAVKAGLNASLVSQVRVHSVAMSSTTSGSGPILPNAVIKAMSLAADAVGARQAIPSPFDRVTMTMLLEPTAGTTLIALHEHATSTTAGLNTAISAVIPNSPVILVMAATIPVPDSCRDGEQNNWETGIDCGVVLTEDNSMACAQCEDFVGCVHDLDCLSQRCFEDQCAPFVSQTSGALKLLTSPLGVGALTALAVVAGYVWIGGPRRVEQ